MGVLMEKKKCPYCGQYIRTVRGLFLVKHINKRGQPCGGGERLLLKTKNKA